MSYTPPAYNAADFSFTGVTYSPRSNFTWDPLARTVAVSGFSTTQFGSHSAAYLQITQATGAEVITFGTPTHTRTQQATSLVNVTQFGLPKAALGGTASGFQSFSSGTPTYKIDWQVTKFGNPRLFPLHVAPGLRSTQFGTPLAKAIKWVTTLGQITRFGTPLTRTDRTGAVTAINITRFGTPFVVPLIIPNLTQTQQAFGWAQTAFGTPVAMPEQFGAVTGFSLTQLGTPTSRRGQRATGMLTTLFGQPQANQTAHPAGFKPVQFGTPTVRYTLIAASAYRATRWGLPLAGRSNTYLTAGRTSTAFGHPTGFSRFNKSATGFTATQMGTPTCHRRNKATMLPPATMFGMPLLKRNLLC